jgi:hypothetical protein
MIRQPIRGNPTSPAALLLFRRASGNWSIEPVEIVGLERLVGAAIRGLLAGTELS